MKIELIALTKQWAHLVITCTEHSSELLILKLVKVIDVI